ncbi:MAG: 3-hydroxyacyl-CoA dehydrogenase NAD-binding domain-containing protein, partial [Myxococcales bacterium]
SLLLDGTKVDPQKALAMGLVDQLVAPEMLLPAAKQWLLREGARSTVKPWDKKGFVFIDGAAHSPKGFETFMEAAARTHDKTHANYPAALGILSSVYEGSQVDMNTALRIESRYFVKCLISPQAKSMVRTLFSSMGEVNKLASRPRGIPPTEYKKIGILGAGMMGSGLAYVAALAGLQVVLIDTTIETAHRGKQFAKRLLDKKAQDKLISDDERLETLRRIKLSTEYGSLRGCELVIEAVYEDRRLKFEVIQKAEAVVGRDAILASDTSHLPITGLAEASSHPENFIGLHFFSPVEKMQLVEIVVGRRTSEECLARAMDFARAIEKTPIVVHDSRGFYTSRVFSTYVLEGIGMLAEGVVPALIENAARMAGMAVGPLAVADEISVELAYRVRQHTQRDLGAQATRTVADDVLDKMVETWGRLGKKIGKGFYDYSPGKKRLWPGLSEHFPASPNSLSVEQVMRRLMYIQSLETFRCLEEKVVLSPQDADVGSVLGWGFAPFLGGTVGQMEAIGVGPFVRECDAMALAYGPRFSPPALLREMAAGNRSFYP